MATTLDVVNECLASMGEAPLNTLTEPHAFKSSALQRLSDANRRLQATGWWFNIEALTIKPDPLYGKLQVPGDCLRWQSGVRSTDTLIRGKAKPWVVQRGTYLYDTRNQTFVFTEEVTGEIVREVPFDELPQQMSDYVRAEVVMRFQSGFDADTQRRQELAQALQTARLEVKSENTRQLSVNLIDNNVRLQRIKSVTRRLRY